MAFRERERERGGEREREREREREEREREITIGLYTTTLRHQGAECSSSTTLRPS